MSSIQDVFTRLRARAALGERGASLVEYALLLALIAVVCIGAVTFIGTSSSSQYNRFGSCWAAAGTSTASPTNCH